MTAPDYTGRSREGYQVTSSRRPGGRYGWDCGCGANGDDYLDAQEAAIAARFHRKRCGRPDRPICH